MSAARDLLERLAEIGATLEPTGDHLILRAGATPVPAELVRRLAGHQDEGHLQMRAPNSST
jgi:hypothetical protein